MGVEHKCGIRKISRQSPYGRWCARRISINRIGRKKAQYSDLVGGEEERGEKYRNEEDSM